MTWRDRPASERQRTRRRRGPAAQRPSERRGELPGAMSGERDRRPRATPADGCVRPTARSPGAPTTAPPPPRDASDERSDGAHAVSHDGGHAVHSLGEARAHRRLRATQPDPRTRARRTIRTTRPLLVNRFGAGRPRPRLICTLIVLVLVLGGVLAKVGVAAGDGRRRAARPGGGAVDTDPRAAGPARCDLRPQR